MRHKAKIDLFSEDARATFWSKVEKTDTCWLWNGSIDSWGYGMFSYGITHRHKLAHRLAYQYEVGPIEPGKMLLHNCPGGDNSRCVNPAHLTPGTMMQNRQDMIAKGRASWSLTHCPKGHELAVTGMYTSKNNKRACKECSKIKKQKVSSKQLITN